MEPAQTPLAIQYKIRTRVSRVTEEFTRLHTRGFGSNAEFIDTSKGWFLTLEGSYERIHVGTEQPEFKRGDEIEIIIRKHTP